MSHARFIIIQISKSKTFKQSNPTPIQNHKKKEKKKTKQSFASPIEGKKNKIFDWIQESPKQNTSLVLVLKTDKLE